MRGNKMKSNLSKTLVNELEFAEILEECCYDRETCLRAGADYFHIEIEDVLKIKDYLLEFHYRIK